MQTETSPCVAREWVTRLSSRLAREKQELALFLVELAEFDRKKLGIELGYPSTMSCLAAELGLTESSACRRISAARMLARFPSIAGYLLSSRLTLTTLVVLKDVLDETNVSDVLESAAGLSEPEVRALVLRLRMAPQGPANVVAAGQLALATGAAAGAEVEPDPAATTPAPARHGEKPDHRDEVSALTLWVGREFHEELAAVRDLLSHAVPSGTREDVLLHALREIRRLHERRRFGAAKRGTPAKTAAASQSETLAGRYIPAPVRREIYERDEGSCAYVGSEGKRCGSTWRIELQHVVPYARGGEATVENLALFCKSHNLLQAEKDFGVERIAARRRSRAARAHTHSPYQPAAPHPHAVDAVAALTNLGYKPRQAEQALALALTSVPPAHDLPELLRACLRVLSPRLQ